MSEIKCEPVDLYHTSIAPDDDREDNKCPIIFIHGLFSSGNTWNAVKYEICNKTKRKVYCIDVRNQGQSPWTSDILLTECVADVEHFMKQQNIPRAIFVCHSIGSRIGMQIALSKPELVEKIVVEDYPVITTPVMQPEMNKMLFVVKLIQRTIENNPNSTVKEIHEKLQPLFYKYYPELASKKSVMAPLEKDKNGKFIWNLNLDAVFNFGKDIRKFDLDLSTNSVYRGKSLFLKGDQPGSLIKDENEDILKYFPNTQFYTFKGGYHSFHLEFPKLFEEKVVDFIEDKDIQE